MKMMELCKIIVVKGNSANIFFVVGGIVQSFLLLKELCKAC